jgi:hypothetical protein
MTRIGTRVFLEVHPDVYRQRISISTIDLMAEQLEATDLIDWAKARDVVRAHAGIARDVSVVRP